MPSFRYALLARFFCKLFPIERKNWIFGSDYGNMYRESSKYLIEYLINCHPDFKCTFVTKNKKVYQELKEKKIPCLMNDSIKAVYTIARAEAVFSTQWLTDIDYDYPRKGRHYYYLGHGQPLKVAYKALSNKIDNPVKISKEKLKENSFFSHVYDRTVGQLLYNWKTYKHIDFVSASSNFLKYYMQLDFGEDMDVRVLGMPRNDGLFDEERMKKERWIGGLDGKFIVTYMPTHRLYGNGEITPMPFLDNPEYQKWMRENDVVLLMKQHPNMIPKLNDVPQLDVIRDITREGLDPQVCIYHTDVLVTDFSSVWMDFLLLKRPIIFYIYDDFETMDVGCYYDIREDPPGHFCYTEDDLFQLIKNAREYYDRMRPSEHIVSKYHKFQDGKTCERYYNEICKELNYQ